MTSPTSNAVALVELKDRLLRRRKKNHTVRLKFSDLRNPDGPDAWAVIESQADLIQSQAARIAELEGERDEAIMHLQAMSHVAPRYDEVTAAHDFLEARSLLSEEVRGDYGQEASVPSVQGQGPASHGEGGA